MRGKRQQEDQVRLSISEPLEKVDEAPGIYRATAKALAATKDAMGMLPYIQPLAVR